MPQANPAPYSIRTMSGNDIASALRLCRAAGWNQIHADWQRLLQYNPAGCFVACRDGNLIGTVTTTGYGRELGWIGMMLVDPRFRRQGIATALISRSVNHLKSRHIRCISLDATPEGERVYRNLGFEPEWTFHRWSREGSAVATQSHPTQTSSHLPKHLVELDRLAFGADRSELLKLLNQTSSAHVTQDGYGLLRPGHLASCLGPVSARTPEVAEALIAILCRRTDRTIFWDIPAPNEEAVRIARSMGFSPVRDLTRMSLAGTYPRPDLTLQYALADPAVG